MCQSVPYAYSFAAVTWQNKHRDKFQCRILVNKSSSLRTVVLSAARTEIRPRLCSSDKSTVINFFPISHFTQQAMFTPWVRGNWKVAGQARHGLLDPIRSGCRGQTPCKVEGVFDLRHVCCVCGILYSPCVTYRHGLWYTSCPGDLTCRLLKFSTRYLRLDSVCRQRDSLGITLDTGSVKKWATGCSIFFSAYSQDRTLSCKQFTPAHAVMCADQSVATRTNPKPKP